MIEVKIIGTEVAILLGGQELQTLSAAEALELMRELELEKDTLDSIVYAQLEEDEVEVDGPPSMEVFLVESAQDIRRLRHEYYGWATTIDFTRIDLPEEVKPERLIAWCSNHQGTTKLCFYAWDEATAAKIAHEYQMLYASHTHKRKERTNDVCVPGLR